MPITEQAGTELQEAQATAPDPSSKQESRKRTRQPDTAFRGVRKRTWGRYVSEIRLPGQKTRIWLGSFGSPEMAARAHDSAAFFLKGSSASLNFPDLVESLPRPLSSSRRDIQSAAARAAFELMEERSKPGPTHSTGKTDSTEWWDQLGMDSIWTTSLEDVKETPLMSPLGIDFSIGELSWNEIFNDEILLMASTLY